MSHYRFYAELSDVVRLFKSGSAVAPGVEEALRLENTSGDVAVVRTDALCEVFVAAQRGDYDYTCEEAAGLTGLSMDAYQGQSYLITSKGLSDKALKTCGSEDRMPEMQVVGNDRLPKGVVLIKSGEDYYRWDMDTGELALITPGQSNALRAGLDIRAAEKHDG